MRSVIRQVLLVTAFLTDASAVQVPSGTDLHIRLTSKVSSADGKPGAPVTAVLIAPVVEDGKIIVPPGAELTGTVRAAQSAAGDLKKPPTLDLAFKQISCGGFFRSTAADWAALTVPVSS